MLKWFKNCNSSEAAKKRFKELANKYHPDKPKGDDKIFMEIKTEYDEVMIFFKINNQLEVSRPKTRQKIDINKDYLNQITNSAAEIAANATKAGIELLFSKFFNT